MALPSPIPTAGTGGQTSAKSAFGGILRGDTVLAIGIVTILTFMLIPIPTFLLDMGLALSILFSIFILMLVLAIEKPLEFSTFPTV